MFQDYAEAIMKKYFYTIGEVSNLLGVKPYVIRFWESEISFLRPRRDEHRIRKYSDKHIEMLKKLKYLLYDQHYTLEGARQKLRSEYRKVGYEELVGAREAESAPTLSPELKTTLKELKDQLLKLKAMCHSHKGKDAK
jgi:DNA-binding transcriptional MerR regulator